MVNDTTLPETNIFAPKNGWFLNTSLSYWVKRPSFRGEVLLVSGRVKLGHPQLDTLITFGKLIRAWNPKQPFINGCFNWMIPNLYIGNGCFTKHPFFLRLFGVPGGLPFHPWISNPKKLGLFHPKNHQGFSKPGNFLGLILSMVTVGTDMVDPVI